MIKNRFKSNKIRMLALSTILYCNQNFLLSGQQFQNMKAIDFTDCNQLKNSLPISMNPNYTFIDPQIGLLFDSQEIPNDYTYIINNLFKNNLVSSHPPLNNSLLERARIDNLENLIHQTLYFYARDESGTKQFYSIVLNPEVPDSFYFDPKFGIVFKPNISLFWDIQHSPVFIKDINGKYFLAGSLSISRHNEIDDDFISCILKINDNTVYDKIILQDTLGQKASDSEPDFLTNESTESRPKDIIDYHIDHQTTNSSTSILANIGIDKNLPLISIDTNTILSTREENNHITDIASLSNEKTIAIKNTYCLNDIYAETPFYLISLSESIATPLIQRARFDSLEMLNNQRIYCIHSENGTNDLKAILLNGLIEEESSTVSMGLSPEEYQVFFNDYSRIRENYKVPFVYLKTPHEQHLLAGIIQYPTLSDNEDPKGPSLKLNIQWLNKDSNAKVDREILKTALSDDSANLSSSDVSPENLKNPNQIEIDELKKTFTDTDFYVSYENKSIIFLGQSASNSSYISENRLNISGIYFDFRLSPSSAIVLKPFDIPSYKNLDNKAYIFNGSKLEEIKNYNLLELLDSTRSDENQISFTYVSILPTHNLTPVFTYNQNYQLIFIGLFKPSQKSDGTYNMLHTIYWLDQKFIDAMFQKANQQEEKEKILPEQLAAKNAAISKYSEGIEAEHLGTLSVYTAAQLEKDTLYIKYNDSIVKVTKENNDKAIAFESCYMSLVSKDKQKDIYLDGSKIFEITDTDVNSDQYNSQNISLTYDNSLFKLKDADLSELLLVAEKKNDLLITNLKIRYKQFLSIKLSSISVKNKVLDKSVVIGIYLPNEEQLEKSYTCGSGCMIWINDDFKQKLSDLISELKSK